MDNQIFNQSSPTEQTPTVSSLPLIYAGFWRRFFALFIDWIITALIGGILGFAIGRDILLNFSLSFVVGILYYTIFDSSEMMGTPGKALLGIAVVKKDNLERLSFKTAIFRHLAKLVSGCILLIGYLVQPFTEKRQTFHDIVAETLVIKKDIGTINYFTAFKNNFSRLMNS